jgi:hypothetical protein
VENRLGFEVVIDGLVALGFKFGDLVLFEGKMEEFGGFTKEEEAGDEEFLEVGVSGGFFGSFRRNFRIFK